MPDLYKGKIPIIYGNFNAGFLRGTPDDPPAFGGQPRDFDADPVEMRDSPSAMKTYDRSEWDALYDKGEEAEDTLEHLFLRGGKPAFAFLDQGRYPDCWFHSTAHAIMLDKMRQNLPVPRLNAVAGATLVGRLDGGWSGLSMKFCREHGCPRMGGGPGEWPQWTRDRRYDTPALRAAMRSEKVVEDWYDFGRREWDQELMESQLATCGFNNQPAPVDYDRFAHAMCQVRWVRIERGHWASLVLNSHQGWGYFGLGVIAGRPADGSVGLRSTTPA
jgi:hypothetical protein